jgi:hypothetical protein
MEKEVSLVKDLRQPEMQSIFRLKAGSDFIPADPKSHEVSARMLRSLQVLGENSPGGRNEKDS